MRINRVALGLALAACAPRPAPQDAGPAPDGPRVRQGAPSPVITLERMACFGRCPVYRISISAEGIVQYEGKINVEHMGPAVDTIPAAQVDSLVQELGRAGYFDFASDYVSNAPACGQYRTDSPTVITSVSTGRRVKLIRHDYGCRDAPAELARLEARIDEVAGSSRWTGR